jgi:hypothetical protein
VWGQSEGEKNSDRPQGQIGSRIKIENKREGYKGKEMISFEDDSS